MHDMPNLVFKGVCPFNMNAKKVACSKSAIGTKCKICPLLIIKTSE